MSLTLQQGLYNHTAILYHEYSSENRIEIHDSINASLQQRIASQYSYARTARFAVRFALPAKAGAKRQRRRIICVYYTMTIPLKHSRMS